MTDQTPSAEHPNPATSPARDAGREGRAPEHGGQPDAERPDDDESAMERADAANGEPDATEE